MIDIASMHNLFILCLSIILVMAEMLSLLQVAKLSVPIERQATWEDEVEPGRTSTRET